MLGVATSKFNKSSSVRLPFECWGMCMISLFQSLLAPGKCVGDTQVWVCHHPQKHYYDTSIHKQRSALLTWFMGRGFACRRVECWHVRRDKWPCFEQVQKNWVKYRVLSKFSRSDSSFIIFTTIDFIRLRLPNVQQIPLENPYLAFRQGMQIRIHLKRTRFGWGFRIRFVAAMAFWEEQNTQTRNDCEVYRYETYVCNYIMYI